MWVGAGGGMLAAFLIGQRRRDLGWVDVGWAGGIGVAVLIAAFDTESGVLWRRALVATFLVLWSLRLAGDTARRRLRAESEDARYAGLRALMGERQGVAVPALFASQWLLALFFAWTALPGMRVEEASLRIWDLLGIGLWVFALAGEVLSDLQLDRFRARASSRGKTCREGLWRYSRHPNYFFEWLLWCAYAVLAIGTSLWWVAILGPITIFVFLRYLTGVPPAEIQSLRSRGDDYRRYQAETSPFFPWFPKPDAGDAPQ